MKTHTHKTESMPRQYLRIGVIMAGVGFVVVTGLVMEATPIIIEHGKKIVKKAAKWTVVWIKEFMPGRRDYP